MQYMKIELSEWMPSQSTKGNGWILWWLYYYCFPDDVLNWDAPSESEAILMDALTQLQEIKLK